MILIPVTFRSKIKFWLSCFFACNPYKRKTSDIFGIGGKRNDRFRDAISWYHNIPAAVICLVFCRPFLYQ